LLRSPLVDLEEQHDIGSDLERAVDYLRTRKRGAMTTLAWSRREVIHNPPFGPENRNCNVANGGGSMKRGLDQETKQSSANPVDIGVQDIIRQRAYELYEERGRGDGGELQDWVEAETEVLRSGDMAEAAA